MTNPEAVEALVDEIATLDVFLAAYGAYPDSAPIASVVNSDDDLLTLGQLRKILAALSSAPVAASRVRPTDDPAELWRQAYIAVYGCEPTHPKEAYQAAYDVIAAALSHASPVDEGMVSLTEEDIRKRLYAAADEHAQSERRSGLSRWCREHGVNRHHVNEWLNGKRAPQKDMLTALGLRLAVVAVSTPKDTGERG